MNGSSLLDVISNIEGHHPMWLTFYVVMTRQYYEPTGINLSLTYHYNSFIITHCYNPDCYNPISCAHRGVYTYSRNIHVSSPATAPTTAPLIRIQLRSFSTLDSMK